MIVSASRRTDIPAFYSDWLMDRIRIGSVKTRNPFNPAQEREVSLRPEDVDCLVFWTKDPLPMLDKLQELDRLGYDYYFQFTLNPYGRELERNLRDKADIAGTFMELARRIGRERVRWRYDPIILNDTLSIDWHREAFAGLCERLSGSTESVTVSFVDLYAKVRTKLVREITPPEMAELSALFSETAGRHGLPVNACCEPEDLSPYGVGKASCIDKVLIERITGYPLKVPKDRNQRPNCGCAQSVDIGAYNTCAHGCVYCYAGCSPATRSG